MEYLWVAGVLGSELILEDEVSPSACKMSRGRKKTVLPNLVSPRGKNLMAIFGTSGRDLVECRLFFQRREYLATWKWNGERELRKENKYPARTCPAGVSRVLLSDSALCTLSANPTYRTLLSNIPIYNY